MAQSINLPVWRLMRSVYSGAEQVLTPASASLAVDSKEVWSLGMSQTVSCIRSCDLLKCIYNLHAGETSSPAENQHEYSLTWSTPQSDLVTEGLSPSG